MALQFYCFIDSIAFFDHGKYPEKNVFKYIFSMWKDNIKNDG